ncbi:unnamed protein product [Cyclocybe aegerita]|uniref:NADH:flavin oxidoreductase/NADH oxidase N-terminal domain-containing protein n=1 Tax=Cyclocybe aegerita TaxID=1973307 RepID=A0A8S0VRZ7_CYCAE|nr:unnamed protein product [Cyclocybe aegerita]
MRRQETENTVSASPVFQQATLPCGRVVQNRLVKVALYEHLATFNGGPPNTYHHDLYSEWAAHDWGIIITGNVQIAPDHLTVGRDMVVPPSVFSGHVIQEELRPFETLASVIHGVVARKDEKRSGGGQKNGTLAIMQLNHPGRQSSNFMGGRMPLQAPLAPSALRVNSGSNEGLVSSIVNASFFQTPKEMSEADILETIERFTRAAVLAQEVGFDGIQLHVAHGYLLSQFLSQKTNKRKDAYSYTNALDTIIKCIVDQTRACTRKDFVVGIKLNAADYTSPDSSDSVESSLTNGEQQALKHLLAIASWGTVDMVEISGGDYEKPDFMNAENYTSKSARQAFFARFSHQALRTLSSVYPSPSAGATASLTPPLQRPLIILTGGLRTPRLLHSALEAKHADLLGIGRSSILCPDLPSLLREKQLSDDEPFAAPPDLRLPTTLSLPPLSWLWALVPKVKVIGAGVNMAWYVVAMRHISESRERTGGKGAVRPDYTIGGLGGLSWMWAWTPSHPRGRWTIPFLLVTLVALVAYLSPHP